MNTLRKSSWVAFLCIAVGVALSAGAETIVPDDRDRQVLEKLLLHLLADTNFHVTRVAPNGATIVLVPRTPDNTGILSRVQINADIGDRKLPNDANNDLQSRNTPGNRKPDSYEAVSACYTNLTFASGIVVSELYDGKKIKNRYSSFEELHPHSRGWVIAYLPGYSKDGNRAVVRAFVGPWPHSASLTAVLVKRGGKWEVDWYHIAFYA